MQQVFGTENHHIQDEGRGHRYYLCPSASLVPRPRPAFRRLQYVLIATESWAGPGNEATLRPKNSGENTGVYIVDVYSCILLIYSCILLIYSCILYTFVVHL